MRHERAHRPTSRIKRPIAGAIASLTLISGLMAASSQADPADDAMAKLNELSRQAEQTTEAMHSAQLDLNNKVAAQESAERKHAEDVATVDEVKSQLATFQTSVNKVAAAQYMGGRTSGVDAILTASSPQQLIEQLAVQRVMATEMSAQMKNFRSAGEKAVRAEQESAKSAADAKTAAEQAAAVRADLQSKQSQLQVQIAIVKSQYQALTPAQREAMNALPPTPPVPAPEALPPAQDPAVLADPPNGIPPGDVAPPEGAVPGDGSGHSGTVIQAALSRIGSPYSWGAAGPSSFDCSGLVMWAFQHAGISLPHSSQAMARGGQPVSADSMQPGDVVTYYPDASHVGIYIGDGMMVHASTYGTPVRVAPVNNAPIYNIRRY
ncbi:peptidoglycan hydrolase RipC [Mycolicibacterium fortuitum]|uniref:NLP/P60 family protein n=1 Tax=Mycolicibacterium fortuitum subsp. fortuitum DSM 46621 = ATCC 6841 = JCM 6387 TaxID=1214102 RepID=K0V402_MYCFO|nr:peptidoglycan hydrolase RipC [Mycolicibacterium fortuitum]EJZ09538.1 NLP/P60 family protein [Mycolicibacterium fortuitum subsp. fortuitum DSM 46621 = ATCC 6841 = JCM 6387]WEV30657.1 peptidoglycan hydrolase RipC [Mycolicibacterium fortuitum]